MAISYGINENKNEWIHQAEDLLFKLYEESFEIMAIGKSYGTQMNNTYSVIARPEGNYDCVFEAEIHKEGKFILDSYISNLLSQKIKSIMEEKVRKISENFFLYVGTRCKYLRTQNKDITLEQYLELNPWDSFSLFIALDVDQLSVTVEDLNKNIQEVLNKLYPINGYLNISVLKEKDIQNLNTYIRYRADIDSVTMDILESGNVCTLEICKGNILGGIR